MGTGAAVGSGGIDLVVLPVAPLLGVNPGDLADMTGHVQAFSGGAGYSTDVNALAEECRTGADAKAREDCRVVGFVNSIQAYWKDEFARRGVQYPLAKTELFTASNHAACGYASAATGPFYCPADQKVYLDLAFFEELRTRFGALGGPFAEAYVLAHEHGHHVQNLAGALDQTRGLGATGPQSAYVRTELEADCLVGVWMHNAAATGYLTQPPEAEIAQSVDATGALGDDRSQRQTQGYVSPESWTHGSSERRQQWLMIGVRAGNLGQCQAAGGTR